MSTLNINKQYTFPELDMDNDSVLPIVVKPVLPSPPWVAPDTGNEQGENSVSVYVRVRPLLDSLLPGAHSTWANKARASVMVVNISPAWNLEKSHLLGSLPSVSAYT